MQPHIYLPVRPRRRFFLSVVRYLYPYPRRVRDNQEPVLHLNRLFHHHILGIFVFPYRVFLYGEVRRASRDLQTRRRAYRPQRIVRHNAHITRLRQRRYLLRMRYPARQAHIRPYILHSPALQQHVEFVYGM